MTKRPTNPLISLVIPCYNEEESLDELHRRLSRVMSASGYRYEIIFCNDGSGDRTMEILREICHRDPHVKGIDLSRNFGHQLCLTAGLDSARGDATVMMDADLQDPPELIPKMIEKWKAGADVVYAVRRKRKGEKFLKKLTASLFYRLLRMSTKIAIPLDTGDFRLIDRKALDAVLSLRESNRFLRGLFSWVGFNQVPIYYVRQERYAGETKYPLRKMVRFALDGLTSFSMAPLRLAVWLGVVSATLSFIYGVMVIYEGMTGGTVPGWASTTVSILFLGGIQLMTIGLLGEYIGRIFEEVKSRPLYLIKEVVGSPEPGAAPTEKSPPQERDA